MKAFFAGLVNGTAAKFVVAVLTTVAASLPLYYGSAHWVPVVVMVIGAVSTYLVPNAKPAAAPAQPAVPPEHLMP
jgi:type IV secretory pathway VirB2 component (pilin)